MGRTCSSIVGPAEEVLDLWRLLEPYWGPAREIRAEQPLLAIAHPPLVTPDPLVQPVPEHRLDDFLPASIAMFTEEVGVDPRAGGADQLYRHRVGELLRARRAFARWDTGRVVFKAEFGAVTRRAVQVQGVWVAPERRGEGLAAPGMAAVIEYGLAVAPHRHALRQRLQHRRPGDVSASRLPPRRRLRHRAVLTWRFSAATAARVAG